MTSVRNIIRLSFRDYSHEWRMSGCSIFALASVLAPMMILFGLKFGIVSSMVESLVENPTNREIRPIGSGQYSPQWIEGFRQRSDTAFIIAKTRALAANIQLKSEKATRILSTELAATAERDPLLSNMVQLPNGYNEVILSQSAAHKLQVTIGEQIDASLARRFQGQRERIHLPLRVIGIADAGVSSRNIAFVSLALLVATEQFKDGRAVPALGWGGDNQNAETKVFPSFRLYARSIYDVEGIVTDLEAQGIRVKARVAEINTIESLDHNLAVIFWIIACVGSLGFAFSLGASLWANVDRKRKELSVLQLIGFKSSLIVLFPVLQSCYTAILGWILAVFVYLLFEQLINRVLAPRLNLESSLCYLLPEHFFWALAFTVVTAAVSAILGGLRAASIEPSDGLRDL